MVFACGVPFLSPFTKAWGSISHSSGQEKPFSCLSTETHTVYLTSVCSTIEVDTEHAHGFCVCLGIPNPWQSFDQILAVYW